MNEPAIALSSYRPDFQKVQVETVPLVNAVSNALSGFGSLQAGISILCPAENVTQNGKAFTRTYFMSPVEIAKSSLDDKAMKARLMEIMLATPIRYDALKHEHTFLNTKCLEYEQMEDRLIDVMRAACHNFRRDLEGLITLFDAFTQPNMTVPPGNTFYQRAAFDHRDLLQTFRVAQGLPEVPEPTLTAAVREELTKRGISTHGIADRDSVGAQGLMHHALPEHAVKLRESAQGGEYGKEVQMILHVLGAAIVSGEIPGLVMGNAFRTALRSAIEAARIVQTPTSESPRAHVSQ